MLPKAVSLFLLMLFSFFYVAAYECIKIRISTGKPHVKHRAEIRARSEHDCTLAIDESKVVIVEANCTGKGGSLTGLIITGAVGAVTYKWVNQAGEEAFRQKDLTNFV